MNRRDFTRTLTGAAGLGAYPIHGAATIPTGTHRTWALGEPYELAANRLVFTNWYYVRPGSFGWYDSSARRLTLGDPIDLGGAHLERTDYPHGIQLVAQPARRTGPILLPETPWEQGFGFSWTTVLRQEGAYRAWVSVLSPGEQKPDSRYSKGTPGVPLYCYYESSDGKSWTRRKLGIFDWGGSRSNNILAADGGTVFIDPSGPASERYKWVAESWYPSELFEAFRAKRPDAWEFRSGQSSSGAAFGMKGAVSPDGLRWSILPEPLVMEASDTQNVAYYDTALGKYVLYIRMWSVGPRSPRVPADAERTWSRIGRRAIGRAETADFRKFALAETILEPGPEMLPSDVLYTNCKTTVPGAPDHHLMFPAVWHTADDSTSIMLASSADGRTWHFLPGSPVFSTGTPGEFDGGCIFACPNLMELPDGSFALPYTGYRLPHKYPRGRWRLDAGYAVWPKGRLVALEARDQGEFATVGIIPPKRKLHINLKTLRGGGVLVEAAAMNGKPLAGRSFADAGLIFGDHFRAPVTWKGEDDIGHPDGAGVIFRFRLDRAEIFGLEFS